MIEFQYLSIFKYGYQALMLNEYTDLDLPCESATDWAEKCNPLGEFNSPEGLETSIWALVGMYAGCYMISLLIMIRLSKSYE